MVSVRPVIDYVRAAVDRGAFDRAEAALRAAMRLPLGVAEAEEVAATRELLAAARARRQPELLKQLLPPFGRRVRLSERLRAAAALDLAVLDPAARAAAEAAFLRAAAAYCQGGQPRQHRCCLAWIQGGRVAARFGWCRRHPLQPAPRPATAPAAASTSCQEES